MSIRGETKEILPRTAADLLAASQVLTFGCSGLDEFFDGGLRRGITEIVGEAGAGKTQLVMQLLLHATLPKKFGGLDAHSFCLSTEGDLPMTRLRQLADATRDKFGLESTDGILSRVYVKTVQTLEGQRDVLFNRLPILMQQKPIRLIVVDSIAALFRAEYNYDQMSERSDHIFRLAGQLKRLSDAFNCHVVVVNQVSDLLDERQSFLRIWSAQSSGRRVVPSLGLAWTCCVDTRLFLTRSPSPNPSPSQQPLRRLHVVFSPYLPPGTIDFEIDHTGLHVPRPAPAPVAPLHHPAASPPATAPPPMQGGYGRGPYAHLQPALHTQQHGAG